MDSLFSESGGIGWGKGEVVGYVRVSTPDQNPDRQTRAIGKTDKIFLDRVSGKDTRRPGLDNLKDYVREGDLVRVSSPDRLARSTVDLLKLLKFFEEKNVVVEFVDNPLLSTNSPQGMFMLTILGAVGEFERSLIHERQAEGIAAAKARGVYERVPKMSDEDIELARKFTTLGVPKAKIARQLGVSRATVYNALNRKGIYAPIRLETA